MNTDTLIQLPVLLTALLVLYLLWGGFLAWRWRATQRLGADVYAAKREQGELKPDVSAAAFLPAFMASEGPRAPTYFFLSALACTLALPPLMAGFGLLWEAVWQGTGAWPPTGPGTLVHTFSLFLFSMGVMIGVLAFAMRRYHLNAPPNLKRAIDDLNGDA